MWEVRHVTEFRKLAKLGEGTYGTVWRAWDTRDRQLVALKKLHLHPRHSTDTSSSPLPLFSSSASSASERARRRSSLDALARRQDRSGVGDGVPQAVVRELGAVRRAAAAAPRRVVAPKGVAYSGGPSDSTHWSVFLILEYCPSDLAHYLDTFGRLSPPALCTLAVQLLRAVHSLHTAGIAHRDMKPGNILLRLHTSIGSPGSESPKLPDGEREDPGGTAVALCDFGLARIVSADMPHAHDAGCGDGDDERGDRGGRGCGCHVLTGGVTTLWYRAPEVLRSSASGVGSAAYGAAIDLWGVGCVLAECALGQPLFPATTEADLLTRHRHFAAAVAGDPDACAALRHLHRYDADAAELIVALLEPEPHRRVSAVDALRHPWLRSLRLADPVLTRAEIPRLPHKRDWTDREIAILAEYAVAVDDDGALVDL